MADKELKISISSDLKAQGFDAANKSIKDLSASTDRLSKNFSSFVGIAASLGAITLFKNQINETLQFADSLNKLSQKTGISADGLYSLSAAAKLSDVEFKSLESSLAKFSKGIGEASLGTGTAKEAFERLGVSIKKQDGSLKDSFDLLAELSEQFKDMPDGAMKATTAMQLFGKSGADMIPLLNSGSDALKEFSGIINNDTAKAAEEFNDSLTKVGLSTDAFFTQIVKDLSPTIKSLTQNFNDLAESVNKYAVNMDVANRSVFDIKTSKDFEAKKNLLETELRELQKLISDDDGWLWFGLDDRTTGQYVARIARIQQQLEQLNGVANDTFKKDEIYVKNLDDRFSRSTELTKEQYEELYNIDKKQQEKTLEAQKKTLDEAKKLQEDWAKRSFDISYNMAIAQQDEMAKPYIELQKKYDEDIKEFENVKGAKEKLTAEFNANIEALNKKTVETFNKAEEAKAKKSAEWQVKLFDAQEKLSDQLLSQQSKMYGDDSQSQIDSWYDQQLYWLGELSQQSGATGEELEKLLAQIDEIKELKIKEQTLSFKMEQGFFNSFEDNLSSSIEGAFNGRLDFKKFFSNIGNDLISTFSKSISGGLMGGNNLLKGVGALVTGSAVSASEIGSLMNAGGIFDSATNSIKTAGGSLINLGADGSGTIASGGSDVMSLLSNVSTLKTAYGLLTNGVSGTIAGGFNSVAGGLGSLGFDSAGTWLSQFGGGFASPLSTNGASALMGSSTGLGAVAGSAALGYGIGSIGDMIFGAETKAGITGAAGAAIGSIIPGIGTLVGALVGSVLGGMFGSTKQTDAGISFSETTGNGQGFDTVQSYADMKKKSWFSSKSWTNYTDLSATDKAKIEGIFNSYDFLLTQLGDTDKIIIGAGKYSGESFADEVTKKFIEAFTDINQSVDATLYNAWKEYAESVNQTVLEAMTESINTFISTTRAFDVWALNRSGDTLEALQKQAQWASDDLRNLSDMLGVTGVTVENYTERYKEAAKNSLDPTTISNWQQLGTALQTATNAQDAYRKSINDTLNSMLSDSNNKVAGWVGALGAIQTAIDGFSTTKTSLDTFSMGMDLTNYQSVLSALDAARQNDIQAAQDVYDIRLEQLNYEKQSFDGLFDIIQSLTREINGVSSESNFGFYGELEKARSAINAGEFYDLSSLTQATNDYIGSVKDNSVSKLEYVQKAAELREEIASLSSGMPHGTLESIEIAIKAEQAALTISLGEIDKKAQTLLETYKQTSLDQITYNQAYSNAIVEALNIGFSSLENALSLIIAASKAAQDIKSLDPTKSLVNGIEKGQWTPYGGVEVYASTGGAYAMKENGASDYTISLTNGTNINSVDAGRILAETAASQGADAAYALAASVGVSASDALAIYQGYVNGSHANGLDFVPFDGYRAELHKGERVQTASEVKKDTIITMLSNEIKDLKDIFIKNTAEMTRMSKAIQRVMPDGDALQVRTAV